MFSCVVIDVFDPLFARNLIEGRLRNVDKTLLYQLRHLPVEKRKQQRADVRPVNVRIGHDNDFVVTKFLDIERAFAFAITNTRADSGNHCSDLGVLQDLVQTGFLDVDKLAANRQDSLKFPIASLLG